MKKFIKAGLLSGLMFLMVGSAWALPIDIDDTVKMSVGGKAMYTMTKYDGPGVWISYDSFCLESSITFTPDVEYEVDSVEDYATSGGNNLTPDLLGPSPHDTVSVQTKWLFASYLSGDFGFGYGAKNKVQNAIWWLEDETTNPLYPVSINDWTPFSYEFEVLSISGGLTTFLADWDIQAVNLTDASGTADIQSQLVGSKYNPVPEPATMVLFGIGLLGIAGMGRKRTNK